MCWRWEWAGSTGERRGSGWQGEDLAGDEERVGQVFPKARCSKAPRFPMGQEKNMALVEATTRDVQGEDCPRSNTSAQERRRRCGGIRSLAEGGRNLARMR